MEFEKKSKFEFCKKTGAHMPLQQIFKDLCAPKTKHLHLSMVHSQLQQHGQETARELDFKWGQVLLGPYTRDECSQHDASALGAPTLIAHGHIFNS